MKVTIMHPAEAATLSSSDSLNSTSERQFYVFEVRTRRLALPALALHRVIRAVEVMAVPGALTGIAGGINVAGNFVPVIDLGPLLVPGGPTLGQPHPDDHFILTDHEGRMVAIWAQAVCGLVTGPEELVASLGDSAKHSFQSLQTDEGLVLVCDLDLLFAGRTDLGQTFETPPNLEEN